ncbi:hypothetical protein Aple_025350 [Acrocarpospora pleiomorpha]|uniref:Thiopeptide-type bacteriocin biosynthesis domain-containing protein n=1 Tax=Acrocarpospora pleiomorpha TaxID=90975 RepID=A0A5M3XHF8_9ACTN|nr:thiopeptide-type bacteriocin biosynthesis protein [Acrocarpospora pleiomorpha]GES19639.1 hypothetical protein Aple_025350 [Acrocarpospora pleiomorpha]
MQWDTYFPETARFGGPAAMDAAEAYFAADSATALIQLTAITSRVGPDLRAMTAASLLDIAAAFLGDADTAMRWLISHTQADPSPPDRAIYDQAVRLAQPGVHEALAGSRAVDRGRASCWMRRTPRHRGCGGAHSRRACDRHESDGVSSRWRPSPTAMPNAGWAQYAANAPTAC